MNEEQSPPTPTPPATRLARAIALLQRWRNLLVQHFGIRALTEKLMGLLRLFATVGLLLIVGFVVYQAVQSARLVLVKPFAVPQSMSGSHADAGRVIANTLKQELLDAENSIYTTIKRGSNGNGKVNIEAVTGNTEDYLLGANIKLPETGISINDVVEFIASIFGRRNITGSVYYDQDKLFLQVELEGHTFVYQRDLNGRDPKALNLDLIADMLRESRTELLSVASESHNLYYYCTGEADAIEYPEGELSQWFDYCAQLKSSQITPENLDTLLHSLRSPELRRAADDNDTLKHILNQTIGNALDKTRLICPDYPKTKVCKTPEATFQPRIAIRIPQPPPRPPNAPAKLYPNLPDASAFQAEAFSTRSMVSMAAPAAAASVTSAATATLIELPSVPELQTRCAAQPQASQQDVLASNQTEGDATLLFNNNLEVQALEKYAQAITQNCNNAFAWANMGVLLMAEGALQSISEAQLALEQAVSINNRIDWIQNSLCIARAYAADPEQMETLLGDAACLAARAINPANKVLLDKQFYIAIADRYFTLEQYLQAYNSYQAAMSVDRKRDCNTSKTINKLYRLETEHQITGAWQMACDMLADAAPLPDNRVSACEDKLATFKCP
ncbi:MAG: hypothetical protein R3E93_12580 [Thiothrix sp.]